MSEDKVSRVLEKVAEECKYEDVLAVLEARLGPLLRAGHELYMEEWGGTVGGDNWIADSAPGRYIAALATLEGRE